MVKPHAKKESPKASHLKGKAKIGVRNGTTGHTDMQLEASGLGKSAKDAQKRDVGIKCKLSDYTPEEAEWLNSVVLSSAKGLIEKA